MPDFYIRAWSERILQSHQDYRVTADTLEEAALKLSTLQNQTQQSNADIAYVTTGDIVTIRDDGTTGPHAIIALIDEEMDVQMGYIQLDDTGKHVRHLTSSIPSDEVKVGESLNIDWHPEEDATEENQLYEYQVFYKRGDESNIVQTFDCKAETASHAREQCANAEPKAIILRVVCPIFFIPLPMPWCTL